MQRAALMGLCLVLMAGPARAQDHNVPVAVQVPTSTRAAGLGNAYLLSSPDADAIFYNPGLLTSPRGISVSLSRFGSGSHLINAAVGTDWLGGGLAFGVASLSYSAPSTDTGAFALGESALWRSGSAHASEQVGIVSYARTVFGFRVGGAAKLLDLRVAEEHSVTGAFDLGVVRSIGPVTLGFAAQNLGPDPGVNVFHARLPRTFTASGATRSKTMGPLDVSFAGSSTWLRGDFRSAGGGAEISYWPIRGRTFTARVGYRWVQDSDLMPLTFGLGFTGDSLRLDYAVEVIDGGRATHRFTFRLG